MDSKISSFESPGCLESSQKSTVCQDTKVKENQYENDTNIKPSDENSSFSTCRIKKRRIRMRLHGCETCGKSFQTRGYLESHMRCHSGDKPFECNLCNKAYRDKNNLKIHMRSHSGELPYLCNHCGKGFTAAGPLRKHERTHTGEKSHPCSICPKKFISPAELRSHMRTHSKEKPYMCSKCGSSFSQLSSLKKHELGHSDKKPFECSNCEASFITSTELQEHMIRRHKISGRFVCAREMCGKSFMYAYQLKKHEQKHNDTKPFGCASCGRCYKNEIDLKKHEIVHGLKRDGNSDGAVYKCNICDTTYKNAHGYAKHLAKKHMTDLESFVCSLCGKEFGEATSLKKHEMIHTGERPLKCEICGKGFIFSLSLKRHIMKHKGDLPYKCSICEQGFFYKTRLEIHMMVHKGTKPFSCSICSKGFTTKRQCEEHKLVHSTVKSYLCSTCGLSFKVPRYLKEHMKIHMADNPHKCSYCFRTFTKSTDLLIHVRVHTGDKPYKCTNCNKSFACMQRLSRHKITHLRQKPFSCSRCSKSYTELGSLRVHIKKAHQGDRGKNVYEQTNDKISEPKRTVMEESHIQRIECPSPAQEIFHGTDDSDNKVSDLHTSFKSITPVSKNPSQIDSILSVFGQISQTHSVNNMDAFTYDSISEPQQIPVIFNSNDTKTPRFHADLTTNVSFAYAHFSQSITNNSLTGKTCCMSETQTNNLTGLPIGITEENSQTNQGQSVNGSNSSNHHTSAVVPIDISYNPLNEGHAQQTANMQFIPCDNGVERSGNTFQPNFSALTSTSVANDGLDSYNADQDSDNYMNVKVIPRTHSGINNDETPHGLDTSDMYASSEYIQTFMNSYQNTDHSGSLPLNLLPTTSSSQSSFMNTDVGIGAGVYAADNNEISLHETVNNLGYSGMTNAIINTLNINRPKSSELKKKIYHTEERKHGQCSDLQTVANSPLSPRIEHELKDNCSDSQIAVTNKITSGAVDNNSHNSLILFTGSSGNEGLAEPNFVVSNGSRLGQEKGEVSEINTAESPVLTNCETDSGTPTYGTPKENLGVGKESIPSTDVGDEEIGYLPTWKEPCSCSLCGKEFLDTFQLKQHMILHTGKKPFRCSLCDTGFVNIYAMEKHMMIHRDERPFECSTCSKGFRRKAELEKHNRIHTDQRPYPCPRCSKTFRQRSGLDNHMRTHTGEAPYECSICHKRFKQSTQVRRHMVVHTKEKNFKCVVCDEAFCYSDTLKRHMKKHRKEQCIRGGILTHEHDALGLELDNASKGMSTEELKTFICSFCDSTFYMAKDFMNHMEIHDKQNASCNQDTHMILPENHGPHMQPYPQEVSKGIKDIYPLCDDHIRIAGENINSEGIHVDVMSRVHGQHFAKTENEQNIKEVTKNYDYEFQEVKKTKPVQECPNVTCVSGETPPWMCAVCGGQFGGAKDLRKHMTRHTGSHPFKCTTCNRSFTEVGALRKHIGVHRKDKNLCSHCGKVYGSVFSLRVHMKSHSDLEFVCQDCGLGFISITQLNSHTRNAHTNEGLGPSKRKPCNKLTCSKCNKMFKSKTLLIKHLNSHKLDNKTDVCVTSKLLDYRCSVCSCIFPEESELKTHLKGHIAERKHLCSTCGKGFVTAAQLKIHIRIHTGEKPYKCKTCGRAFHYPGYLTIHKRIHSGERPYTCNQCGKRFIQVAVLNMHMKSHLDQRPFRCRQCHKSFKCRRKLTIHMRVHSNERPYTCRSCGKGFKRREHCKNHEKIHSGLREHVCPICEKTFIDSASLLRHQRTHSGERPYKCSICGKAFAETGTRNKHKHTHTHQTKALICYVCGQVYTDRSSLNVHMQLHTGAKPFGCPTCHKGFMAKGALNKHMKSHTINT